MDKKQQFLLLRIEKAGVRASRRQGRLISRDELLELKIQIIPLTLRVASAILSAASAWACYVFYTAGGTGSALGCGLLAFLLLLFALFGFRKSVERIVDSFDAAELVEAALEGIGEILSSISL